MALNDDGTELDDFEVRAYVDLLDRSAWVEVVGESGRVIANTRLKCLVIDPDELGKYVSPDVLRVITNSYGANVARSNKSRIALMHEPKIEGWVHDGRIACSMMHQLVHVAEKSGVNWFFVVTKEQTLQNLLHKFCKFAYLHKFAGGQAVMHRLLEGATVKRRRRKLP